MGTEQDRIIKKLLGCRHCGYQEGHAPKCMRPAQKQQPQVHLVAPTEAWLDDEEARMF